EQLRQINKHSNNIILEPISKNTAPAIALAALSAGNDTLLLVLPADHVIEDEEYFNKLVLEAKPLAKSGKLVTFGIVPTKAHTGYGYIKSGRKLDIGFVVDQFMEKPSTQHAKKYFESGEYYWNSGIFLFNSSRYLEELKKFRPNIYQACKNSMQGAKSDFNFLRVDKARFEECPRESVDFAVMENTEDAVVIAMDAGWSDVGSWSSLWDITNKDKNGNVVHGDVVIHNSNNSLIRSDDKMVAAIGVDNLVIAVTKDVVMIANKDNAQDVNIIVKELQDSKRNEWETHREVYRPWGKYDLIDYGNHYQVKKITVKPGAALSLQKHQHRAEHWIVVIGTAKVTKGEKTLLLAENESVYIPIGVVHALENPGESDLELIEIQSGTYLGEDDIIRLQDRYGRDILNKN
ncbi:MAG: mannose-1-phosphate guanylyltransferase/mannose-6-phosphate isomerase, partial [Gammaproteobacteria bacterium]|nr:mannose-1-phosphate guanylyltransferase/mannose-6-phosphate isomerase [Gammaproteobacteria bacterium]